MDGCARLCVMMFGRSVGRSCFVLVWSIILVGHLDASPGNSGHGPARSRDRNERGETAMHVAAIKGDQEGIKKLLEQGMSPNVPDFAGKLIVLHLFIQTEFHTSRLNNLANVSTKYWFRLDATA